MGPATLEMVSPLKSTEETQPTPDGTPDQLDNTAKFS